MRFFCVFVLPASFMAIIVVYMLANPSGPTIGQVPAPPTAVPAPTEAPLPEGLAGAFTYRSGVDLITVRLPSGEETSRTGAPPASAQVASADGLWMYTVSCAPKCSIYVSSTDRNTVKTTGGGAGPVAWSPTGHTLAYVSGSGEVGPTGSPSQDLVIVEDPGAGGEGLHTSALQSRVLLHDDRHILDFAWIDDSLLIVSVADGGGSQLLRVSLDGTVTQLSTVPSGVYFFYPSPDHQTFAYTVNHADGWRMNIVDAGEGTVRDLGNMGSDPTGVRPPVDVSPDGGKGPMYIAWSPDGSRLAFGGGFAPPYTMKIVDLTSGNVAHTEFPNGYPGEIEWSPDGTLVAVSSYDPDRTRHETFVVDPASGEASHLLNGCILVWSPDSRFLAVHGEPDPGISLVDVHTGETGKLTHEMHDTPWRWVD